MRIPTIPLTLVALLVFAPPAPAQDARAAVEQFVTRLSEITVTEMVVTQTLTLYDPKDSRQQVTGPQRLLIKLPFPFRRTAADLLVEWRGLGVQTEVAQTVRVGGRPVTLIGAREGDRTSSAVWLDPDYGVIRFITREEGLEGVKLLDLAFSEHRKVLAGFFYPFRQEIFLDGKLLSVTAVRNVEVNTGLPDSLFDPDALLKGASR
ncbi:MAG: hypothetical protein HYW16_05515 [Candidatus Rokubacteria bacterium]|nr:hypothetical protein [Candidatus Rokubacteria bacterium]